MGSRNRRGARPSPAKKAGSGRHERQVGMRDVAKLARVAPITVSRTLAAPGTVSAETRKRVQAAIKTLGYVPNLAAGTLSSSRSRIVAVVVPNMAHSVFAETLQGLSEVLHEANYHLLIGNSGYSLAEEEALVSTFLARRADGIILTGYTHSPGTLRAVRACGVPMVEMWNVTRRPHDTIVGFSNFEAARAMTHYLARKGYQRVAYVGGLTKDNDRTAAREEGFRAAMSELGRSIDPKTVLSVPFEYEAGAEAISVLMERQPRLDAVFAAGDILAVGVLLECVRRRIPIPKRIAIAGFDDAKIAQLIVPSLTTVRIPRYEIGRTAARKLLARIAGESPSKRVIDLGFEIVEREST